MIKVLLLFVLSRTPLLSYVLCLYKLYIIGSITENLGKNHITAFLLAAITTQIEPMPL